MPGPCKTKVFGSPETLRRREPIINDPNGGKYWETDSVNLSAFRPPARGKKIFGRRRHRLTFRYRDFSTVKEIIKKKSDALVKGIPGNIKTHQFMDECIGLGIRTNTDAKPAVCADSFPERKTLFLVNGPVTEAPAEGFFSRTDGLGGAVVCTFFAYIAKFFHGPGAGIFPVEY